MCPPVERLAGYHRGETPAADHVATTARARSSRAAVVTPVSGANELNARHAVTGRTDTPGSCPRFIVAVG